jgi:hypothetical protein
MVHLVGAGSLWLAPRHLHAVKSTTLFFYPIVDIFVDVFKNMLIKIYMFVCMDVSLYMYVSMFMYICFHI